MDALRCGELSRAGAETTTPWNSPAWKEGRGLSLAEYYAAFRYLGETFDANADVTPFVRFHLEAQLHQIRALDLREGFGRGSGQR